MNRFARQEILLVYSSTYNNIFLKHKYVYLFNKNCFKFHELLQEEIIFW